MLHFKRIALKNWRNFGNAHIDIKKMEKRCLYAGIMMKMKIIYLNNLLI